jgi:hypothetical protein
MRRMVPHTTSAALVASVVACVVCAPCSATASGAPQAPSALRWSAPAECPDARAIRRKLDALVGPALAVTVDADVVVRLTGESRYRAEIQIRSRAGSAGGGEEKGERTLEEGACEVLADAVATVIGMSVERPTRESAPAKASTIPVSAPALVATERLDAPSEPRFAAGLAAMVDEGTLPLPAVGVGIAVAWYPAASLRIEAVGLRWLAQSATVEGQAFGGTFQLTSGDVRACWSTLGLHLGDAVAIAPCAGIEVAHVDAKGFNSTTIETGEATWWSPSVGAHVHWTPARAFGLAALADVVIPVARPTFVIDNGGSIHQASAASVRGQIIAEVRF